MQKYCLALDLKDDARLIRQYEIYHEAVWPQIRESITASGIVNLEIYRVQNRLFMILEAGNDFSFEKKGAMDAANPTVQQWEELMWTYQQALPGALPGQKWMLMQKIYDLNA
jgi:L-rhamnose mutarotase